VGLAAASTTGAATDGAGAVARRQALETVRLAADSLVARRTVMPTGGWAWRSAIQAPHFHTDRDVGAASVGAGLLAAHAVTGDRRYLRAAAKAGDYLLAVAEPAEGGLRWPDWADPDGRRSTTHYTSFDDGAAGISDYLWRLFEATRETRFRRGALAGMRWVVARAEDPAGSSCPDVCGWKWRDDPTSPTYHGVGMGEAGIVWTLDLFADRTGEATFRAYARAGAARLRLLTREGRDPLPQRAGSNALATGFLSGSAGAALVLLERFARDRKAADRTAAARLLSWVNREAIDSPEASATGFEEGAAGIAWVDLQAFRATGRRDFLESARRAAAWLRHVATTEDGASSWSEEAESARSPVHVGLDSGAAGIGWVLSDLAASGIDARANRATAWSALAWLQGAARRDARGAYWFENRTDGQAKLRAEPSWHWGSAGIAAFAAHLAGHGAFGPGGQPLPR
jgi:lantibiotic modifying enzyme